MKKRKTKRVLKFRGPVYWEKPNEQSEAVGERATVESGRRGVHDQQGEKQQLSKKHRGKC